VVTAIGAAVTGLSSDRSIANRELWKAAPWGGFFCRTHGPGVAKSCRKVERAPATTKGWGREDGVAILFGKADGKMPRGAAAPRGGTGHDAAIVDEHVAAVSEGSPAGVRRAKVALGGGETGCDRDRGATRRGEARSLLGDALTAVSLQRWHGQISRLRRDAVRDNAALRLTSSMATSFGVGRPQPLVLVTIGRAPSGRRAPELTSDSGRPSVRQRAQVCGGEARAWRGWVLPDRRCDERNLGCRWGLGVSHGPWG
jgi:hypothetical protein